LKSGVTDKKSKQTHAMDKSDHELARDVIIVNELGLHARSAAKIAQYARSGESKIWIIKDENKADATNIFDVLTLVCEPGATITIKIDDPADLDILHDLVKLIESGFGE
jgi:phosphocarrier protein